LAFSRIQEQYRTCPTVLLLDDVAAHLDDQHRLVLFQEICGPERQSENERSRVPFQVWMTGTDRSAFQALNSQAQFLTVQNATLTNGF
jgi:DNA replication and repair protein RecF